MIVTVLIVINEITHDLARQVNIITTIKTEIITDRDPDPDLALIAKESVAFSSLISVQKRRSVINLALGKKKQPQKTR